MFNCPECGKSYTKQTSLTRHLQNHLKNKQYTCKSCHVCFYRHDLLSRHSKMHRSRSVSPAHGTLGQKHVPARGNQGRQRCHTACISCRISRTKCDGSQPCLSCASYGKTCQYSSTRNRISRAPVYNRSAHTQFALEQSPENEIHDGDEGEPASSGRDQDGRHQHPKTHSSYMDLDQPESDGLLPSPAASSDAPFVVHEANMLQLEMDSFTQSFPSGNSSIGGPSLLLGAIDPLVSDLALDTTAWPWLHESLFLQTGYSEPYPETHQEHHTDDTVDHNPGGRLDHETIQMLVFPVNEQQSHKLNQPVTSSQAMSLSNENSWRQRRDATYARSTPESSSNISLAANRSSAAETQLSESTTASQIRVVDEIVAQATDLGSFPDIKVGRATYWQSVAMKVGVRFALQDKHPKQSPQILEFMIDLYLQHFGPLWPLLSRQNLDYDLLHPLLYLTLTSIGAMYGGLKSAHFGTLLHYRLRQSLTNGLDLGEIDEDLVWLGQARLLTQVAALYFGQSQAFSYAQHLGGILVAQARRMNLFHALRYQSEDSKSESLRPTSERLARWLFLEARRRLAFGILRAETYTSVLLNTRPLVSPEEIDLELPYADSIWRGPPLSPEIFLAMVERERASRQRQRFSDVARIAFERDEVPSGLDALGQELLLFGMQQSVWRFSHDHSIFLQLTVNMELSSQLGYDGLDVVSVSGKAQNYSLSSLSAGQMNHTSPSSAPEDHLCGSPKRMHDLRSDLDRLMGALQRWKKSLKLIQNEISLKQDRNSVLSSLLLYHLSYLRLQAPVEDMHYLSYRIADNRPVERQIIQEMHDWANSSRATITVEHACTIWSLICRELRRPEANRAKFNFLAFTGLHHAAVSLWIFMGARNGDEMQDAWSVEPLVESDSKIAVSRNNSRTILELFSQVFNLVGPGGWSSFGVAALKLSSCQLPSMNE